MTTTPSAAPTLDYLPREPKAYSPGIGVVGCGNITKTHLAAYRKAGYRVRVLCDCAKERAEALRNEFFPEADVVVDYRDVLSRDDVEVVDLAVHPEVRVDMVAASLEAGRHVLSQKPFVLDLADGERLVALAERKGLRLAVNQNGRWAPHFSYIRRAVAAGLIGDVVSVHFDLHWDHSWTAGTAFDEIPHLILYDFAIHWFDMTVCLMGDRVPKRVYASTAFAPHQRSKPPLLAQAVVEYEQGRASLVFDGASVVGSEDHTVVVGTEGLLRSVGPEWNEQTVTLTTKEGSEVAALEGTWFTNGFHGTMAELLCAIEEGREPYHSARNNLGSLALCFAAVASAEEHRPMVPGEVRRMPGSKAARGTI